jgi:hypothetical protein
MRCGRLAFAGDYRRGGRHRKAILQEILDKVVDKPTRLDYTEKLFRNFFFRSTAVRRVSFGSAFSCATVFEEAIVTELYLTGG